MAENWWDAAPKVTPDRSGDEWWKTAPVAERPDLSNVTSEPVIPDRSWREAIDDTALGIREGVRNVAGATLGLPVNIANVVRQAAPTAIRAIPGVGLPLSSALGLNRPEMLVQPEAVRGTQEELRRTNAADAERWASNKLVAQRQAFESTEGVGGTLRFLARNPTALVDLGAQQVGQVLNVAPGAGTAVNIAAGGLSAGGQTANEVAADLASRTDLTPQQRAALESQAFAASAAVNTALPFVPGARVVERSIGGQVAGDAAERSLSRAITSGLVAEGVTGAASEASDQAIQNLATGRPWDEGVARGAVVGALLEAPLGAAAAGGEVTQARRAAPDDAWRVSAPTVEPPVTPPAPVAAQPETPAAAPPVADVPAPPAPVAQPAPVASEQPVAPAPEVAAAPAPESPAVEPAPTPRPENVIVERSDSAGTFRENRLTREILDRHVVTGDTSALLTDLAQQPDITDGERWLAEKLAPVMRDLGIQITPPREGFQYGGAWDNNTRSLFVRQATPETILHESLHGATSALIDSPAAQRSPEVRQFVADLTGFGQHLQGALLDFDTRTLPPAVQRTISNPNGPLSNPKELLTYAMTNRGFQDFLRQIPAPPGWQSARNAWDALKQAVARLFGATTPAQVSLLDAVIESGGGLVDFAAQNPRAVEMVQRLQQGASGAPVPSAPLGQRAAAEPAAPAAPAAPAVPRGTPTPSPRSTGTKNAVRDAERQREGRDPIVRAAAKSNERTVAEAEAAMDANPSLAAELVERLTTQPSAVISSVDEAVLLLEKVSLRNQRDDAARRAGDEKLTPEQRAVAQREWAVAEADIDRIDQATSASGREWGRLGQFRQRMMREDFTLEAMERRARAVVGGPLSPELQRTIAAQAAKIEALQKQLAESEARVLDVETTRLVTETLDRTIREVTAATKRAAKAGKPRIDVMRERADAARKRLQERAAADAVDVAGLDLAALTDPGSVADAVDLGAFLVAQGASDLADFTAKMKAEIGAGFDSLAGRMSEIYARAQQQNAVSEQSYKAGVRTVEQVSGDVDPEAVTTGDVRALVQAHIAAGMRGEAEIMRAVTADLTKLGATLTERDVRRLFSEYGKATYPSKDEDKRALRELRALVQMQESIDRLTEGLPRLKSGPQRDKATEQIRQKRAQLDALLKVAEAKNNGPEVAAALRAERIRNMQARITELQEQLDTGRRDAPKPVRLPDTEINNLRDKLAEIRASIRRIDSQPARDAQRKADHENRLEGLRAQAEEIRRQIEMGYRVIPEDGADATPADIAQAKAEVAELRKQRAAADRAADQPNRDARARQRRLDGLSERIADLQNMIATGRRPAKRGPRSNNDGEILALETKRDELVSQLRDLDRPPRDPEAIYQRSRATTMRRQMEELQRRIRENDYSKQVRVPRALSAENERLAYELDRVKADYLEASFLESLKHRSPGQKAFDEAASVINFSRAILTGPDVSGVGRQGGFLTVGDPKLLGEGLAATFNSVRSEQQDHAAMERIRKSPNARLYKAMGLDFSSNVGKLKGYEEQFQTRILNYARAVEGQPIRNRARQAKNIVLTPWRVTGRAYSTGLNVIRASAADALIDSFTDGGPLTNDELFALGAFINTATGRPSFGSLDNGAVLANMVFFAPRWVASRFNILLKYPTQILLGTGLGMTPRVRMAIAKRYARYAAGMSVIYSLAFLAAIGYGLGEDEDDERPFIETDPRSSAFGMPRFGDTYVDTTSGLSSAARLIAQLVTGERKNASGEITPLRDGATLTNGLYRIGQGLRELGMDDLAAKFPDKPSRERRFGEPGIASTVGDFVRSKLAPVPGAAFSAAAGENVIGQKTTPAQEAMGLFTPMIWENSKEMVEEHGAMAAPFVLSEALGFGTQLRDPSSFAAPDYQTMTQPERKRYNDYIRATQKTRRDIDELRDIANAFPRDAHPADVRDAVETRAEQLGLDGVSVGSYAANTTARDASGARRTGLKRSESGKVEMEYADWSKVKAVNAANRQVSAINKQIESLYERPIPYDELAEIAGDDYDTSGFGTGPSSLDDRMKVARELATRRAEIMRETMGELR